MIERGSGNLHPAIQVRAIMRRSIMLVAVLWWPMVAQASSPPAVHFEGNREISTAALEAIVQRLGPLLSEGEGLRRLPLEVSALYFDHGFIQVQVEPPVRAADGGILVRLREGPQYRVGKLGFTGPWPQGTPELRALLQTRAGEVFSRSALTADLERLRSITSKHIEVSTSLDEARRIVAIEFAASL